MRLVRALFVASCFAASAVGHAVAAERPLVVGMALEPPHLDPTAGAAAAIDEVLYANVFEGLTRIAPDGTVQPGLATRWEPEADGLAWTFHLRDGVTFHDGSPFDAEVVRFSLDRARADGAENAQPELFDAIETVEVIDPQTVRIVLSERDGNLPYNLAWGDAVMVHPDSAETNKQNPVGTGPFKFDDWRRGDRISLVRHDWYWGNAVALPEVEFAFLTDATVALAALLAGDVNGYPNFPTPEALPMVEADPRFNVTTGTTEGEMIVAFNSRRAPLNDVRVRRALASAIDRQAVIDGATFGLAVPIGAPVPPHDPAYIDLTDVNKYDPERAKALLAEAGVEDLSLMMTLPPRPVYRRAGEIIAAQLRDVGVEVDLRPVEWAEWLSETFRAHEYDLSIVAHTEPNDINIYARPDYYFHVEDQRLNEIISKLSTQSDPDERIRLLREAQRRIADNAVNAFLFQSPKIGVWDARLEGLWRNAPIQANDVTGVRWTD